MATRKSALLERLALARRAKAARRPSGGSRSDSEPLVAPAKEKPLPERDVPADGQRHLAKSCAVDAMIMGWDRAVQKHAYENRISESEMRKILDAALEYNEKADPSGKIDELEDWKHERRGSSTLSVAATRPS